MAVGQVNGVFIYNGQPQNGATAKLWDREVFYTAVDSGETISDNPLTAAAATLNTGDGSQFAAGDLIEVETEHMLVISIAANELTVQRGYDNTTPASHVQTTAIFDLTQDDPEQDDAEPGSGQQGASITTAVAFGGDGAYRWTDVPDGEYFVSVEYDSHRAWLHVAVEARNTLNQILKLAGDLPYRGTNAVERLPKGSDGEFLKLTSGLPVWASLTEATLTVAETEVYSGAGVSSWTDLDLSGTIGAKSSLVLLKVKGYTDDVAVAVRKNGDTDEFYHGTLTGGCASAKVQTPEKTVFCVATDSAGKIEWRTPNTSSTWTIDVIAYIN